MKYWLIYVENFHMCIFYWMLGVLEDSKKILVRILEQDLGPVSGVG